MNMLLRRLKRPKKRIKEKRRRSTAERGIRKILLSKRKKEMGRKIKLRGKD